MNAMTPIKPEALQRGDTIGIVSPSWFGGPAYVSRAQRGIAMLERLGFRVKIGKYAFNNRGFVSDTTMNRIADLHEMFADDSVQAIICSIGGDHSCHLLPHIDWDLIKSHPKIFMGFSDITVLNLAFWAQARLVTFNGPTLLTEWAEYSSMVEFSQVSALRALTVSAPLGILPTSHEWTDEFLNWETGEDTDRRRAHTHSEGWIWIRRGSPAAGRLIGGCLESLQHLRGTPYWPDLRDAILFIETSESCTSPEHADAMLMDFENMGVFEQITGLLVARPYGMTHQERVEFWQIVAERTSAFPFPVIGNMDFGHTSPQFTMPIGVTARIDGSVGAVEILEAATIP